MRLPALGLLLIVLSSAHAADAPIPSLSSAQTPAAAGMVDVQSLVPDLSVDMRYATRDNFIGAPVRGYERPRCYLLQPVAQALSRVEAELRKDSLRLRIYDCYRPVRAVRHFVEWAADLRDQSTKPTFYPKIDKRELLGEYIAATSGHSRGATLDLTLMRCDDARCSPLDMGTAFDFFDTRAHTESGEVTAAQRANRHLLRAAMQKQGFENYALEWWHYTFQPEPSKDIEYDFPVK